MEGMVTKGYRKGVYERVTKGIKNQTTLDPGTQTPHPASIHASIRKVGMSS